MSVTPTTMKCPVCPDQMLETLTAAIGSFERCPNCHGLFVPHDVIAAASQERAQCIAALTETKALLLPTDKWCPKCLQKLFDGRVRSRGVILTLCTTCQAFWTTLSVLRQFEEAVERTILIQIDVAMDPKAGQGSSAENVSRALSSANYRDPVEDAGLGRFFRAFARVFDGWADRFSARGPRPSPAKIKKPAKSAQAETPSKKTLIRSVEPAAPAGNPALSAGSPAAPTPAPAAVPPKEKRQEPEALPAPARPDVAATPPAIEVPEFIFPEEPAVDEVVAAPPPMATAPEPKSAPEAQPEPESGPVALPKPKPEPEPEPEPRPVALHKPKPEPEPMPPEPAIPSAPVQEPASQSVVSLAAEKAQNADRDVAKLPVQQPSGRPGFFAKFKSAWSPSPSKPSTPVGPPPIVLPRPKPVQPVKPAPSVTAAKPLKPAAPGFFTKLFSPKKPAGKPAAPAPEKKMAPVVKKPAPAVQKPEPKPKRVKIPRDPIDHLAVWPPWALALAGIVCSAFRDFGFEGGPAALWGMAGWSIGSMVRLARLYPFKPFEKTTLRELSERQESAASRGIPVILAGQIVPAQEQDPKGDVVFQQEAKTISLNRLGRWDVIPRLFGLANPRQLLKGEVTLKGWYRGGLSPTIEVQEVRAEAALRKSMVRSLRWACAAALLALAVIISLALE